MNSFTADPLGKLKSKIILLSDGSFFGTEFNGEILIPFLKGFSLKGPPMAFYMLSFNKNAFISEASKTRVIPAVNFTTVRDSENCFTRLKLKPIRFQETKMGSIKRMTRTVFTESYRINSGQFDTAINVNN